MEKGQHVIVDFYGIPTEVFESQLSEEYEAFHNNVKDIIKGNGMTLLGYTYNDFKEPKGAFTSLYLLSESHISMHTWPEDNYIAMDVFTCGKCNIDQMVNDLEKILVPKVVNKLKIRRGLKEGFS